MSFKKSSIVILISSIIVWFWISTNASSLNTSTKATKVTTTKSQTLTKSWVVRSGPYKITAVTDGDTFKVSIDWKVNTVRILGMDTPEKYATRTWYKECYGEEASNYAKKLLTWKKVYLEKDISQDDKDKYSRLLRHVFFEDGTSFQSKMINDGYAFYYFYKKATFYDKNFKNAESLAKSKNVWVWKYCDWKREPVKDVIQKTKIKTDSIINK